ncbi:amidohydrolase [Chloroflexota bacterium]
MCFEVKMPSADLILKNATVITVNPGQPFAGLVAVKGDRIMLVSGNDDLESVKGPDSKVIDCAGKTLVPGFNDAHCHVFSFLRKLLSVDLSPAAVNSIEDIKNAIKCTAENTPGGEWITGTDYNDFQLIEKRHPTRKEIDEVAPNHPVILSHRSLHACVLNSMALSIAGISAETEEPPGGHIDRDLETGEPNGLLLEMLGYIRETVMPDISEAELTRGITLANRHYISQGITSVQDATYVSDYKRWQRYLRFKDEGILKSRVSMMCGIETVKELKEAGLTFGSGDNHLRLGGIKIVPSMIGGQLFPSRQDLDMHVLDAQQAGFQVAIHAIQDKMVEAVINTFEYAKSQSPQKDMRHRIEHCSECPPNLLERLKKLRPVVVTQPPFIHYSGDRYLAMVPEEKLPFLYRFKSLLDCGLTVAAGSDSPIVPDNPLAGIYGAVTRQSETGHILQPEERISASQALSMYTINAACASFEEDIKGSITEGKLADMVLLSDNPVTTPPEQIKDIRAEMTIIGGEVVFES